MNRACCVAASAGLVAAVVYVYAVPSPIFVSAAAQGSGAINCTLTGYKASPGMAAVSGADGLTLTWDADKSQELRLRFTLNGGTPTISELAVRRKGSAWGTLASNVTPEFRVVTGRRRMEGGPLGSLARLGIVKLATGQGADRFKDVPQAIQDKYKWDAFWDAPLYLDDKNMNRGVGMPRKPEEIKRATATYQAQSCEVKTDGARLMVTFPGVSLGLFAGQLQFTVFKGSNLIEQEVIAKTEQDNVAYLYNAGLKGLAIGADSRMVWRDLAHLPAVYLFGGAKNDGEIAVTTANRLLIAERGKAGSIAAFPPPHTFFWTRESARNLGYNWYRKDSNTSFSFGIRQSEQEASGEGNEGNFPLYNARPGTTQHMQAFFYASALPAEATRDAVLAYTHEDRYKPVAGYKVMSHHYHTRFGLRLRAAGTPDAEIEDFAPLHAVGINIISPVDNFGGIGNGSPTALMAAKGEELLVRQLQIEGARRHSDKDFLVLPSHEVELNDGGTEPGGPLHMHTDLIYSHPTYWLPRREAGEPFVEEKAPYGRVYHVGSPADMLEMLKREDIVISQPHPRTKGSAGYPEAFYKERVDALPMFKDAHFNTFGYRWGMGIDRSEREWSEIRVLSLLDETNNNFADEPGPPRYLLAISEAHEQDLRDDTYGFSPITYVKLASVPTVDDMSPLVKALMNGDTFVSSGEVLMPSYSMQGTGNSRKIVADLEWTFPLDFVEVVWGDGKKTDRQIISTTEMPQFGKHHFEIPFDATGKKWVRFTAWDVAGNGVLGQPIKLSGPATTASR